MSRPLLSLVVLSFNQAPFIREAIDGALAQTYSPLEIIITDDGSTDGSFEIARRVVQTYRGPHAVQLHRNTSNVGMAGQLNRVMEICKGELILVAAGDDVSLPRRAEASYQAWEQSSRRATSVFSSYTIVSKEGVAEGRGGLRGNAEDRRPIKRLTGSLSAFLSTKRPAVNGCTHAWTPEIFRFFGPLTSNLEDLVLSFRTLAIGEMVYIEEPLVNYRRHESNVSFLAERDDTNSFEHRERRLRWVDAESVKAYENMLGDVATLRKAGRIPDSEYQSLRGIAAECQRFYQLEGQLLDADLVGRWRLLGKAASRGEFQRVARFAHRALPREWYRRLYRSRLKRRSSNGETS